jgi:hypothetical protein
MWHGVVFSDLRNVILTTSANMHDESATSGHPMIKPKNIYKYCLYLLFLSFYSLHPHYLLLSVSCNPSNLIQLYFTIQKQ